MILITGGGGLLGLNLARHLADRGEQVLLLQRSPFQVPSFLAPFWDKQVKGIIGDLLDLPNLFGMIKSYSVDSIVHAAALYEGLGTLYQVLKVNLDGTTNVLETSRILGLGRVTFISSETVYLGVKADVFHEELDLPVTSGKFIPATKKAGEQICLLYSQEYGLSICIIRLGRIYGPTAHLRRNPMEVMVVDAVAGKPVDLPNVYEEARTSPIYVKDCSRGIAVVHLAKSLKHIIYNLSDGNLLTYRDIANVVKELIPGTEIRLGKDKPATLVPHLPLSIERIKAEGFIPDYGDIRLGIKDYMDWIREGKY